MAYNPGISYDTTSLAAGVGQAGSALGKGLGAMVNRAREKEEEEKKRAQQYKALSTYAETMGYASKDQATVMDYDSLQGLVRGKEAQAMMKERAEKMDFSRLESKAQAGYYDARAEKERFGMEAQGEYKRRMQAPTDVPYPMRPPEEGERMLQAAGAAGLPPEDLNHIATAYQKMKGEEQARLEIVDAGNGERVVRLGKMLLHLPAVKKKDAAPAYPWILHEDNKQFNKEIQQITDPETRDLILQTRAAWQRSQGVAVDPVKQATANILEGKDGANNGQEELKGVKRKKFNMKTMVWE